VCIFYQRRLLHVCLDLSDLGPHARRHHNAHRAAARERGAGKHHVGLVLDARLNANLNDKKKVSPYIKNLNYINNLNW